MPSFNVLALFDRRDLDVALQSIPGLPSGAAITELDAVRRRAIMPAPSTFAKAGLNDSVDEAAVKADIMACLLSTGSRHSVPMPVLVKLAAKHLRITGASAAALAERTWMSGEAPAVAAFVRHAQAAFDNLYGGDAGEAFLALAKATRALSALDSLPRDPALIVLNSIFLSMDLSITINMTDWVATQGFSGFPVLRDSAGKNFPIIPAGLEDVKVGGQKWVADELARLGQDTTLAPVIATAMGRISGPPTIASFMSLAGDVLTRGVNATPLARGIAAAHAARPDGFGGTGSTLKRAVDALANVAAILLTYPRFTGETNVAASVYFQFLVEARAAILLSSLQTGSSPVSQVAQPAPGYIPEQGGWLDSLRAAASPYMAIAMPALGGLFGGPMGAMGGAMLSGVIQQQSPMAPQGPRRYPVQQQGYASSPPTYDRRSAPMSGPFGQGIIWPGQYGEYGGRKKRRGGGDRAAVEEMRAERDAEGAEKLRTCEADLRVAEAERQAQERVTESVQRAADDSSQRASEATSALSDLAAADRNFGDSVQT